MFPILARLALTAALTDGLASESFPVRENAERRAAWVASRSLEMWRAMRVGSFSVPDPEARQRLTRAWRFGTAAHVASLLPVDSPWFPDIDSMAKVHRSLDDPEWHSTSRWRAEWMPLDGGFTGAYDFSQGAYPKFREATYRWTVSELNRTGDAATIRYMLFAALQIEAETKAKNIAQDRDYLLLLDRHPRSMNRHYFTKDKP